MRWETHESLGIASYSILIVLIYTVTTINQLFLLLIIVPITLLASVLPDKFDNIFRLEHRGLSHSLLICLSLSTLFAVFTQILYWYAKSPELPPILAPILAFSISYLMHIIADSFTDNGVRLLWPYNKHKPRISIYRLWYYSESKTHEKFVSLGANIVSILIWGSIFYHMLK